MSDGLIECVAGFNVGKHGYVGTACHGSVHPLDTGTLGVASCLHVHRAVHHDCTVSPFLGTGHELAVVKGDGKLLAHMFVAVN